MHIDDRDLFIKSLQAEGCEVTLPRYPLVHQQPLFTEGVFSTIARSEKAKKRKYEVHSLPITERFNQELIKLPSFPQAERALLNQYAQAFTKVVSAWDEIKNSL